jgi:hypothetical protein
VPHTITLQVMGKLMGSRRFSQAAQGGQITRANCGGFV